MKYDNFLNSFEFEVSKPKVNFTVTITRTNIVITLAPSFMDRFYCNFIQIFNMKNIVIKFTFQLSGAKVNVKVAILRNLLLAADAFICGLTLI